MRRLIAVAVLGVGLVLPAGALAGSCGIPPIPPIPPIGCRELAPRCVCDSTGTNCWWEFVCVPYGDDGDDD